MSSKKERNHYDLKEMENIKNAKIVSITWHHNVLTEIFTTTEIPTLLHEKVNFVTCVNASRLLLIFFANHHLLLFFLRIISVQYNFFFKKKYSSSDIEKVKKNIWLLHTYTYLGVVFSCIQAFQGFTSSVCNQYLSGKLVLY